MAYTRNTKNISSLNGGLNTGRDSKDIDDDQYAEANNLSSATSPGEMVQIGGFKHIQDEAVSADEHRLYDVNFVKILNTSETGNGLLYFNHDNKLLSGANTFQANPGLSTEREYIALIDGYHCHIYDFDENEWKDGAVNIIGGTTNITTNDSFHIFFVDGALRVNSRRNNNSTPTISRLTSVTKGSASTAATTINASADVIAGSTRVGYIKFDTISTSVWYITTEEEGSMIRGSNNFSTTDTGNASVDETNTLTAIRTAVNAYGSAQFESVYLTACDGPSSGGFNSGKCVKMIAKVVGPATSDNNTIGVIEV